MAYNYVSFNTEPPVQEITIGKAAADIRAYVFVNYDGSGLVQEFTGASTDPVEGVVQKDFLAGEDVVVVRRGQALVIAGGAVTKGMALGPNAGTDGSAIQVGAGDTQGAVALDTLAVPTADDDLIKVHVTIK